MFEFNVGEKEIHKIKIKSGFSIIEVYIDEKIFQTFNYYPFAFEVGESEKHFVFIQVLFPLLGFSKSSLNIQVFIDNRFHGTYKFE